jgi:predicted acylesterase/phospholipase RssA
VLPHIANSLTDSGESIRVIADSPLPSESQNSHLAIAESGQTDDGQIAWLRHQLHQQSIGEGHTFLSLSADASRDKLARTVSQTDQIWWLVEPQYAGRARQRLSELLADHPGLADRIRWIWVLNNESVLSRVPETPEQLTSPALRFVLTGSASDRLQKQSVSRLVHELRQTRIGIALGGGAARGLAHLGVLKVLEREGIFVDRITGTSAGALMALPYAFGWDPDTIAQTFASDLTPSWPFRLLPRGKEWFMLYKFRTGGWEAMLRHHFDHVRLEQLLLPLSTVTADLITGKEIVRDTGDAVHGVLESINLPAISRPILRDGMALVDGGTLNNVPTDLLSQRGADLVIGVNIASRLPHSFAGNTLGTSAEKMRRPGQLETIMRTNDVQDHAISAFRSSHADFRIDVDTSAFGFADFTKAEQLMQLGEQQAEMVVPELKKLIANRERTLADAASLRFVCPNQLAPASSLPAEASDNSDSRTAEKHGILVAAG